jgi:hypothetical protein
MVEPCARCCDGLGGTIKFIREGEMNRLKEDRKSDRSLFSSLAGEEVPKDDLGLPIRAPFPDSQKSEDAQ